MNPQLLQLQQQLGFAQAPVSSMYNSNNSQVMAALGMSAPNHSMGGYGLQSLLGGLQQPSATTNNEAYIQQLLAAGAGGGGLQNRNMNPATGLQALNGASREQLLQLLTTVVTGGAPGLVAPGGNPSAAARLLSQLGSNGGAGALRSSDPPGSTSGLSSKRLRDADDAKTRALAMLERSNIPNPGLMGRDPIQLYMSCDDERLSAYHALARKHIEFFEAAQEDISTNARGRNRPIVLGQVGIRCRHCSQLPPRRRQRAAMYYPFKLDLLYQACQTLANVHLCEQCQHFPADVRVELVKLRGEKTTALVGKKYWADGARIHDVYESPDGLRFKPVEKVEKEKEGDEEKPAAVAPAKTDSAPAAVAELRAPSAAAPSAAAVPAEAAGKEQPVPPTV